MAAVVVQNGVGHSGADGVYTVDAASGSNEVVTPDGGQVVIKGLAAGTYALEETEAPAGYNLMTSYTEIVVAANTTVSVNDGDHTVNNTNVPIVNNTGVQMPETGGKGTMMLITFGTMIAIGFAVLMITQKKMAIYND